jgi:ketosteroid isomerase-like protein
MGASVTPRELAERWLASFNAGDVDGLVALYSPDAVHHSPKLRASQPETEGRVVGRAKMHAWWSESFAQFPGLHYRRLALTADDERAVLEYRRELPGSEPLAVAEVFVCRGGQIVESFVYHG